VVIEAAIPRGLGSSGLVAQVEKAQRRERARYGIRSLHPPAFDADRIRGKRESHDRDARRRAGTRRVGDQSVDRIYVVKEILECGALQAIEESVVAFLARSCDRSKRFAPCAACAGRCRSIFRTGPRWGSASDRPSARIDRSAPREVHSREVIRATSDIPQDPRAGCPSVQG